MNTIQNINNDLKELYLNYESNQLKETVERLDNLAQKLLENDKTLLLDPFWETLSRSVFKALILNQFFHKKDMDIENLSVLLANKEEVKKNLNEFCHNFKEKVEFDFINSLMGLSDNPLNSVIEVLMTNIKALQD